MFAPRHSGDAGGNTLATPLDPAYLRDFVDSHDVLSVFAAALVEEAGQDILPTLRFFWRTNC